MLQHFWNVGDFLEHAAADQLFHAIAIVALANSCNRSINRHHERRESRSPRSVDRSLRSPASAHQIKLVENRAGRSSLDILELVSGNGGENVTRTCRSRRASRRNFPARMHKSAVSDWSKQKWKSQIKAQHPHT